MCIKKYECRLFVEKVYLRHLKVMTRCWISITKMDLTFGRDGNNDKRNNSSRVTNMYFRNFEKVSTI